MPGEEPHGEGERLGVVLGVAGAKNVPRGVRFFMQRKVWKYARREAGKNQLA